MLTISVALQLYLTVVQCQGKLGTYWENIGLGQLIRSNQLLRSVKDELDLCVPGIHRLLCACALCYISQTGTMVVN